MKDVTIIKVRCDISAGTRGAYLGPDAIEVAAVNAGSRIFHDNDVMNIFMEDDAIYDAVTDPYARRADALIEMYQQIAKCMAVVLAEPAGFPLVLAGDHGTAGGTIAGIKMAFPEKRIGVVWIDAHADAHSPWTTPSGNLHGMPIAIGLGEDNMGHAKNPVSEETAAKWHQLQQVGGISPKFDHKDLVYLGVRDTEIEEEKLIEEKGLRCISVADVRQWGPQKAAQTILEHVADCDLLYISFDVDSLDISISNGTGTPVADGFFVDEITALIRVLVESPKVCCFEIAEVNPTLDRKGNVTAEIAFGVMDMVVRTITGA